jgi:hypothetical protein
MTPVHSAACHIDAAAPTVTPQQGVAGLLLLQCVAGRTSHLCLLPLVFEHRGLTAKIVEARQRLKQVEVSSVSLKLRVGLQTRGEHIFQGQLAFIMWECIFMPIVLH